MLLAGRVEGELLKLDSVTVEVEESTFVTNVRKFEDVTWIWLLLMKFEGTVNWT